MSRNAIRSRRGQLDKLREEVRQGIFRETDERHSRKIKVCYLKPGEVMCLRQYGFVRKQYY